MAAWAAPPAVRCFDTPGNWGMYFNYSIDLNHFCLATLLPLTPAYPKAKGIISNRRARSVRYTSRYLNAQQQTNLLCPFYLRRRLTLTAYPVQSRRIKAGRPPAPVRSRNGRGWVIRVQTQIRKREVLNLYFPFTSVSFISCLPQKASFSLFAQNSGEKAFRFAIT